MPEPTSPCPAASCGACQTWLGLPAMSVTGVVDDGDAGLVVHVESTPGPAGCPHCGWPPPTGAGPANVPFACRTSDSGFSQSRWRRLRRHDRRRPVCRCAGRRRRQRDLLRRGPGVGRRCTSGGHRLSNLPTREAAEPGPRGNRSPPAFRGLRLEHHLDAAVLLLLELLVHLRRLVQGRGVCLEVQDAERV